MKHHELLLQGGAEVSERDAQQASRDTSAAATSCPCDHTQGASPDLVLCPPGSVDQFGFMLLREEPVSPLTAPASTKGLCICGTTITMTKQRLFLKFRRRTGNTNGSFCAAAEMSTQPLELTLQGKVKYLPNDFHTYKLLAIAECKIDEFTPRL